MKPVLFQAGGLEITSYGVSKVVAALVAGWLLAKELRRIGRDPEFAWPLTVAGTVGGFVGAKVYYLAEQDAGGSLTAHDLGGMGFTWFGGLIGGAIAVLVVAHRHQLSAGLIAGLAAAPLAFGYGIGRLGCLLAGDGTYGGPSDLPWAMSFPDGTVPTTVAVHPTPLYEAIIAFALGAMLWRARRRLRPSVLFAFFAIGEGAARFLIEFVRINDKIVAGLTQPQLWSLALAVIGATILWHGTRSNAKGPMRGDPETA